MDLWEILVPTISNTGIPFRTRHHREWDSQVLQIVPGMTIMHPTTKGYWRNVSAPYTNPAVLHEDRTIPVRIACDETQIRKIIDITIRHYNQEAVMAYKVSDTVLIVNRG